MNHAMAEAILGAEKNDLRFEQFVADLFSNEDKISYLPTSQTWDRGRDAVAISPARGSHKAIIGATLEEDLDAKVDRDILRLSSTSSPDRIVYCTSQPISEHKADQIRAAIRRHTTTGSIAVVGAIQLAQLALQEKHFSIFDRHYHGEIQTITQNLVRRDASTSDNLGLRLALVTFGNEDAVELRRDLKRLSVLEALSVNPNQSEQEVLSSFCKLLGIPGCIDIGVVRSVLTEESAAGTVSCTNGKWWLTASGKRQVDAIPEASAGALLDGFQIMKQELETAIGQKFSDSQYLNIWRQLLDSFSSVFYTQGLAVIQGINEFLNESGAPSEAGDLRLLLEQGINKVAAVIQTPELRSLLATALMDIFTERQSAAFNWLTQVCERFVTLCCLGLESRSSSEIEKALLRQRLILDSDVILSYLSPAEPDHQAVSDLITRWTGLGGKILLSDIVLQEVAYHAWISERDFQMTSGLLGRLQKEELRRYIKNVFTRSFHAQERFAKNWPIFISQYRGESSEDSSKIKRILRTELNADILPENMDAGLKDLVVEYLANPCKSNGGSSDTPEDDRQFKIERDAKLLGCIARARREDGAAGGATGIWVLSSSGDLRRAANKFTNDLGNSKIVISIATFSYMLSLVPEAGLSADSLRIALFDVGDIGKPKDHERRAMRIIRASDQYQLKWARRGLLVEQLEKVIDREASARGARHETVEAEFVNGSDPETSARLITQALTNMAVHSKKEEELQLRDARIRELELKLAKADEARKARPKKGPR